MLTKLEHRMLYYTVYIASITQTFPFSWNKAAGFIKLSTNRNIWQKLGNALNIGSHLIHLIYLAIRFIPGCGYTSEEFETVHWSVVSHAITISAFACVFSMQIGALRRSNDLAMLINQLLQFNRKNGKLYTKHGEYAPPNRREKIILHIFLQLVALTIVINPLWNMIFPQNKLTIFSVLPEDWQTIWMYALVSTIEELSWARACIGNWFTFCTGYAYIITNIFWLDKICNQWLASKEAELRSKALNMYKSLRIMNTIYNNGFAPVLFPVLKSTGEIIGMFAFYAILRYHNLQFWLKIFFFLGAPFAITQSWTAIMFMAKVYEKSSELKSRFNQLYADEMSKYEELKRKINSCRPIYYRVGILFYIEKSTKLDYISLLLSAMNQVLLTTT